jgi:hypothetical protein
MPYKWCHTLARTEAQLPHTADPPHTSGHRVHLELGEFTIIIILKFFVGR